MPKSCSSDLRERVLDAVEEGASRREAAERFDVSASSAVKWFQSWEKEADGGQSRVAGASRRSRAAPTRSWLWSANSRTGRSTSSSRPCASDGFVAAAARCGGFWSATASASKKSLRAAEQDRADVARARRRWIRQQGLLDASSLVFIDETSVNTSMARLYGRCPRGERLIGRVPFGTWETLTSTPWKLGYSAAARRRGRRGRRGGRRPHGPWFGHWRIDPGACRLVRRHRPQPSRGRISSGPLYDEWGYGMAMKFRPDEEHARHGRYARLPRRSSTGRPLRHQASTQSLHEVPAAVVEPPQDRLVGGAADGCAGRSRNRRHGEKDGQGTRQARP